MAAKRSVLTGKRACIIVERNGASVRVDDVPAANVAEMLSEILKAFRSVSKRYPEVIPDLEPVGGSTTATAVEENEYGYDERGGKRVGF